MAWLIWKTRKARKKTSEASRPTKTGHKPKYLARLKSLTMGTKKDKGAASSEFQTSTIGDSKLQLSAKT